MGSLRFLLAISVVAAHSTPIIALPSLPGGGQAVQLFFVISGFYMAIILNEKYVGAKSYRAFLLSRFLRIYPLYLIILTVTGLFVLLVPDQMPDMKARQIADLLRFDPAAAILVLTSNLLVIGQDALMFLAPTGSGLSVVRDFTAHSPQLWQYLPVPQAWSLSLELMFYAIAPFIVRSPRRISICVAGSVLLRLFIRHAGYINDPWTFRLFPTELAFFLIGSSCYHASRLPLCRRAITFGARFAPYAVALALFNFRGLPWWASYSIIIVGIPFVFELTKQNIVDRILGEMSYPIYLIHYLVVLSALALIPQAGSLKLGTAAAFGTAAALATTAASVLAYVAVVSPVDRWRHSMARRVLARRPAYPETNPVAQTAYPPGVSS